MSRQVFCNKINQRFVKFAIEDRPSYLKDMEELITSKECFLVGHYSCLAFDTFGPFKLVGGLNKGRPNDNDIQKALEFFETLKK